MDSGEETGVGGSLWCPYGVPTFRLIFSSTLTNHFPTIASIGSTKPLSSYLQHSLELETGSSAPLFLKLAAIEPTSLKGWNLGKMKSNTSHKCFIFYGAINTLIFYGGSARPSYAQDSQPYPRKWAKMEELIALLPLISLICESV